MRKSRTMELREALNLWKTTDNGQCFRPGEIGDGVFCLISRNEVLELRQCGDYAMEVSCDVESWDKIWRTYFDLEHDYSAIQHGIFESGDTLLTEVTVHGGGIWVLRQESFEMLASFVLSQRESISTIRTTVRELAETYGEATEVPPGETVLLFPKPEVFAGSPEESLRNLGLGYRAPYVLDVVRRVADGRLDLDAARGLPDKELFAELQNVYGVRKKVANCMMFFGYDRAERAPSDVQVQRITSEGYQGVDPLITREHAGILRQHLFYYALAHEERSIPRKARDESRRKKRKSESCDTD